MMVVFKSKSMVDIMGKTILVEAIKELIKELIRVIKKENLSHEKRNLISEALIAIQSASIKTRNFIEIEGYIQNEDLSDLWLVALQKSLKAEIQELPVYLFDKAKFWGRPQDWLNEESSMELVPKLNYLDEQCEELLIKVKN